MSGAPLKVLIADDDPTVQKLIARILAPWKVNLIYADDGRAALDVALRQVPDLIFLDHDMPLLLGTEVAAKISLDPRFKTAAIVIVSSETEPEDALKRPYHAWIAKPFDVRAIETQLLNLIDARRGAS